MSYRRLIWILLFLQFTMMGVSKYLLPFGFIFILPGGNEPGYSGMGHGNVLRRFHSDTPLRGVAGGTLFFSHHHVSRSGRMLSVHSGVGPFGKLHGRHYLLAGLYGNGIEPLHRKHHHLPGTGDSRRETGQCLHLRLRGKYCSLLLLVPLAEWIIHRGYLNVYIWFPSVMALACILLVFAVESPRITTVQNVSWGTYRELFALPEARTIFLAISLFSFTDAAMVSLAALGHGKEPERHPFYFRQRLGVPDSPAFLSLFPGSDSPDSRLSRNDRPHLGSPV